MRFILFLSLISLLSLTIATGCQQAATNVSANASNPVVLGEPARIKLEDAKKEFDAGTALIIDTRSLDEYNYEHIKGSVSMPVAEVEKRFGELPKDKKLIFYCS